jgi:predicted RND superfamily exporter protein
MARAHFVIRNRWWIIAATFTIGVIMFFPLMKTTVNSDLESYFPETMSAKIESRKIEAIFGEKEPILIVFESDDVLNDSTLTRIRSLSKAFNRMKDFDMVISLFDVKNIKGEDGTMIVDPVIRRMPKSEAKRDKLRQEIKGNELAYKLVVSDDFRYTLILLNANSDKNDHHLMLSIYEVLERFPGQEAVSLFGATYIRDEANTKILRDLQLLLPIGLLVMLIFLWLSFRQKRGALLPFFVVVASIILSMALLPLFGWELSIISIIIPIMMIAVANDYGVHFIARYQEVVMEFPDMAVYEVVEDVLEYLSKPVVLTGVTTMFGIAGLISHLMLPAKHMGVVCALGIAFAVLLSLSFIPAVLVMLKKDKPKVSAGTHKAYFINRLLSHIAQWVTHSPHQVLYVFGIFLILITVGLVKFKIAPDTDKLFPADHPYSISLAIANEHFGGTKNIYLVFEGDIKSPEVLRKMDGYENQLESMPEVGSITSIASLIRIMSKALNDPGEALYDKIPDTREAVAQYLELYAMSGDPEDLEDLVNFDYTKAIMNVQFQAADMQTANKVVDELKLILGREEHATLMGGYSLIEKELSDAIAKGQVNSLLFAFGAIIILLMFIFRSVFAGFLGSLPLAFAVICTFGLMGWTGIDLNIATALLSSISIGLGVDYTIHMFWRLRKELKNGADHQSAITTSLATSGRGIVINALSVIVGFSILFLSAFPLIRSFAFLIIVSIILCLICALVLIPAICLLVKPKFLTT